MAMRATASVFFTVAMANARRVASRSVGRTSLSSAFRDESDGRTTRARARDDDDDSEPRDDNAVDAKRAASHDECTNSAHASRRLRATSKRER